MIGLVTYGLELLLVNRFKMVAERKRNWKRESILNDADKRENKYRKLQWNREPEEKKLEKRRLDNRIVRLPAKKIMDLFEFLKCLMIGISHYSVVRTGLVTDIENCLFFYCCYYVKLKCAEWCLNNIAKRQSLYFHLTFKSH